MCGGNVQTPQQKKYKDMPNTFYGSRGRKGLPDHQRRRGKERTLPLRSMNVDPLLTPYPNSNSEQTQDPPGALKLWRSQKNHGVNAHDLGPSNEFFGKSPKAHTAATTKRSWTSLKLQTVSFKGHH